MRRWQDHQPLHRLEGIYAREGLELASDSEIEGGARVRLVQDKLEIDLSDRAVARMISQRMVPRFKAILEGTE